MKAIRYKTKDKPKNFVTCEDLGERKESTFFMPIPDQIATNPRRFMEFLGFKDVPDDELESILHMYD